MAEANYYIDPRSSGGDGTTAALTGAQAAWKNLSNINYTTLAGRVAAGDSVFVNLEGHQKYNDRTTVAASGAAGRLIRFRSYTVGLLVTNYGKDATAWATITGLKTTVIADWADDGSNVWKTTLTVAALNNVKFGTVWGVKKTGAKTDCTAARDWFYDTGTKVLYVYAEANPATWYTGGVSPLTVGIAASLFYYNISNYVKLEYLKFEDFENIAIQHSQNTAANNIIDHCVLDGKVIANGCNAISVGTGTLIISNSNILRCYTGISGNAGTSISNCIIAGNRNYGVVSANAACALSNNFFYGNGNLFDSVNRDINGAYTDGGGNLSQYWVDPKFVTPNIFPVYGNLGTDDCQAGAEATYDGFATAAGDKITFAAICGTHTPTWLTWLDTWLGRGVEIASHSWSHHYFSAPNAMYLRYTGNASTATVSCDGSTLAMTLAGDQTDGSTDQSFTLANYASMTALVAAIKACTGYGSTDTALICLGLVIPTSLADIAAGSDIKAKRTCVLDETRFYTNEMGASKDWLEANITTPDYSCDFYVHPGGVVSAVSKAVAASLGYLGARGTGTASASTLFPVGADLYSLLCQDIGGIIPGKTQAQIESIIGNQLFKSALWGNPASFYFHPGTLSAAEIGYVVAAIEKFGTYKTMTEISQYLAGLNRVDATDFYAGEEPQAFNLRLSKDSPLINAGVIGEAAYNGPYPDIGAYEHSSQASDALQAQFGRYIQ